VIVPVKKKNTTELSAQNAAVLAEIVTDPLTTEATRVEILNMLSQLGVSETFFQEAFKLALSFGECPICGHEDHWLIPPDELAILGWIVEDEDPRVKRNVSADDCPRYAQACPKRKTNF
jgi:hypothetical protein